MNPQPKSPNVDLDRLDALHASTQGRDVFSDGIVAAYPALSRELRELRERLNPQPCTACDGTGRVDTDADDGGSNCGVCRNGMVDEVSRKLAVIERQAKEIEELRKAIQQTINENLHLADGDNCTLRHLVAAMEEEPNETHS